jgi:hypothetical protein
MFEKRLSYVDAYKALVERLKEDRIFVLDKSRGWTLNNSKGWAWLFIDSSLGRRRRLYALAHESGHLFCYPKAGNIRRTVTKLRSEDRADEFAIRVCKELLKMDVTPYYKQFKKSIKTRKKYLKSPTVGRSLMRFVSMPARFISLTRSGMSDICKICGKPEVTEAVVTEWEDIDWGRANPEVSGNYRNDLCWRKVCDECYDAERGQPIDDIDYLCNQRDKLIEENQQLKDLLIFILGFSTISVTKSEMEKLEEIKEYVRIVNQKRRDSKVPV